MGKRDNLRNQFVKIIQKQLGEDLEPITTEYFESFIEKGKSEEKAIELLAFYLELFVVGGLIDKSLDASKWKEFLEKIEINLHLGEYEFDRQDERYDLRTVKKRFGELKNDVGPLEDELLVLECHFLILHEQFKVTSRELKKIIHVVIHRILDVENHESSDYSDYVTEDLLCLADGVEQICNPYVNIALKEYLQNYIQINDENYDKIFKNVLLCLTRILKSIDMWEKQLGNNGYFRFISQFISIEGCLEAGPEFFFNDKTLEK